MPSRARSMREWSHSEHLEHLRKRPGTFGPLDGSYRSLVTYLHGLDAGTRGAPLTDRDDSRDGLRQICSAYEKWLLR
ncbi:hypothetical protein SUDANB106_03647 [Streptomyces sp. enrichment culture]|uniref:hypothetical protein n=1 Tax=Streptomyces sp. enrichment culture TaxID=1795815 RepID=UPI00218ACB60|nr:hypothetical protein LUW77_20340 [Streptomyces radiopugnans]